MQCKGKLPAQMFEEPFAVLFPQMRDHFRIGRSAEDVALRLELGALLDVIE